jgi:hypothetical protein
MFAVPDIVPDVDEESGAASPRIADDAEWLAIKPMNCPAHVMVFKQGITSYRDLPIRLGEMGCCHRNEPHGALHGLMRVRQFTQDDAHIFCTEGQVVAEVQSFLALADSVYRDFGFTYDIKLALRPEKRFGSEADWDKAEQELRDALTANGLEWEELPGEGAFYAPKLEWHLTDAIGRTWQVGTIQSDRVLPERLDANYIGEDGEKHRPVMLHRAIFGSYERFIGILIEHFAGRLPAWLAPVQAVVATIVSDADGYAEEVAAQLRAAGIRVETDTRNEKINYKVREHSLAKVPQLLVVGLDVQLQRAALLHEREGKAPELLGRAAVLGLGQQALGAGKGVAHPLGVLEHQVLAVLNQKVARHASAAGSSAHSQRAGRRGGGAAAASTVLCGASHGLALGSRSRRRGRSRSSRGGRGAAAAGAGGAAGGRGCGARRHARCLAQGLHCQGRGGGRDGGCRGAGGTRGAGGARGAAARALHAAARARRVAQGVCSRASLHGGGGSSGGLLRRGHGHAAILGCLGGLGGGLRSVRGRGGGANGQGGWV